MNSNIDKNFSSLKFAKLFIIGIFLVVGLSGCGGKKKEEKEIDHTETNSFFIKNEDNKYALFNEDGKKLTDLNLQMLVNF